MSFDYSGRAQSRIISQYRNDTKLRAFIVGLATIVNERIEAACDVRRLLYSIDDMGGAQLDLIGRVLVQPRPAFLQLDGVYFAYNGTPNAALYGQGPYFDYDTSSALLIKLPDGAYRNLLKSKAAKNNTDCSFDSIIHVAELLTGDTNINLINNQDMTFELEFSVAPELFTQLLLNDFNVIPEPAGVEFTTWSVAV